MGWICNMNGEIRNAYVILVRKPKGKRSCEIIMRRYVVRVWTGFSGLRIGEAVVNTVRNLRVIKGTLFLDRLNYNS
jgi:hypothetical protein